MPKRRDLTGMRVGRLVVVAGAPDLPRAGGRVQTAWSCVCDCGASCIVASNNLVSGNSQSCGCRKHAPKRRNDLTGRRFERLVVLQHARTTARGQAVWTCNCDCGKVTECRATPLLRGKVKSCGCYRAEGRFHAGIGPATWAKIIKAGANCLRCGGARDLHAHHIIPISADKTLERSGFNGECLCAPCHQAFHAKYGKETAGINDFAEFCGIRAEETEILRLLIHSKGRQDIEKAIHELQLLLELRYPE